jgi:hypothetical protein
MGMLANWSAARGAVGVVSGSRCQGRVNRLPSPSRRQAARRRRQAAHSPRAEGTGHSRRRQPEDVGHAAETSVPHPQCRRPVHHSSVPTWTPRSPTSSPHWATRRRPSASTLCVSALKASTQAGASPRPVAFCPALAMRRPRTESSNLRGQRHRPALLQPPSHPCAVPREIPPISQTHVESCGRIRGDSLSGD